MARSHSLKVSDIRRETMDCVSVAFEIPASLAAEYAFKPGQYLTLLLNVNGEELRRSYSICSSPYDDPELRVAVKRVKGGKGSNYINSELKVGDMLEVMTPMGNFQSRLDPVNRKKYFLFAGGSGITPMLSIIRSVLKQEANSEILLFYGNLNEESTIFYQALNELAKSFPGKLKLHYIFEEPSAATDTVHSGRLSREKVLELFDSFCGLGFNHEYFICGPGPVMDNVLQVLTEKKVPREQIHIEYFTGVLPGKEEKKDKGPDILSRVTVSMYGIETSFELNTHGKSILDAALEAGVDVPFACKGAVCCTCRGKVLEGKVKMDQNYALTEAEVAQGYILTCQSHPMTPVVKVDYDS